MYIPQGRERVQLVGRGGVFRVAWVDHERQKADLLPLDGPLTAEQNVPFSEIEPCCEKIPL
jgi:hypothetical protein